VLNASVIASRSAITGPRRSACDDELVEARPALGLALGDPPAQRFRLSLQAHDDVLVGADGVHQPAQVIVGIDGGRDQQPFVAEVAVEPTDGRHRREPLLVVQRRVCGRQRFRLDHGVPDVVEDERVAERLQNRALARARRPGEHEGEH